MATDAPLRRDVRLLGDLLGRVMVEQEGEELLAREEEIRRVSRRARESADPTVRSELASAVGELDLEQQTKILRAFALFLKRRDSPLLRARPRFPGAWIPCSGCNPLC